MSQEYFNLALSEHKRNVVDSTAIAPIQTELPGFHDKLHFIHALTWLHDICSTRLPAWSEVKWPKSLQDEANGVTYIFISYTTVLKKIAMIYCRSHNLI
jgi:hypothetical protein